MVCNEWGGQILSSIFISHRITEEEVADMLYDFLVSSGVESSEIFCSSLPGNDVKEKISKEINLAIGESAVNIIILSFDYYKSAYCLNEAGIIWFKNVKTIIIALPEITPTNMIGFINSDYKIRRLSDVNDISAIYEQIIDALQIESTKQTVLTRGISKLQRRYDEWLADRKAPQKLKENDLLCNITTDDERIVLYYMLYKKIRKVNQKDLNKWLNEEEIYDINLDNAFDLLATIGCGRNDQNELELDIEYFRNFSVQTNELLEKLYENVKNHTIKSSSTFNKLWDSGGFDDIDKLFIAYIVEEKMVTFGDRWMAKRQVEQIKEWESKNNINGNLSKNYTRCLNYFIENKLVSVLSFTDHGNPREYCLRESVKELLLSDNICYKNELIEVKEAFYFDLPF